MKRKRTGKQAKARNNAVRAWGNGHKGSQLLIKGKVVFVNSGK